MRRDHPLRRIRGIVNEALAALEQDFAALYSGDHRSRRGSCSERCCCRRSIQSALSDCPWNGWNTTSCSAGSWASASTIWPAFGVRDRLLEGDIVAKFLAAVLAQPKVKKLLSTDHFSVDGTLIVGIDEEREASMARSDLTRRMHRPPIRMRGSIARGGARRRSSASWGLG